MDSWHHAYGLRIAANRPVPGLPVADWGASADVHVWFAQAARPPESAGELFYRSEVLADNGRPTLELYQRCADEYHFRYSDGTEFLVCDNGLAVVAYTPPESSLADTAYYLNGPVLAFVLRLRGVTCLHASSVEMAGGGVLFAGDCGAGKSTTAAALAGRGHPVITEDLAPVERSGGGFLCLPGYPRVNLWPDSAKALFGDPAALPELAPPWPKRYLDSSRARFASRARPVSAVYVITGRAHVGATEISPLAPSESLVHLMANTYMNYLPDDAGRAAELRLWGALASTVPVRRLTPVAGEIAGLCQAIEADVASLAARRQTAREVA